MRPLRRQSAGRRWRRADEQRGLGAPGGAAEVVERSEAPAEGGARLQAIQLEGGVFRPEKVGEKSAGGKRKGLGL